MRAALERLPAKEAAAHVLNYLPSLFGLINAAQILEGQDPKLAADFFSRMSLTWFSALSDKRISSNNFHFEVVMALAALAFLNRSTAATSLRLLFRSPTPNGYGLDNAGDSPPSPSTALDAEAIKSISTLLMTAAGLFHYISASVLPHWRGDENLLEHITETWQAFHHLCRAEFVQLAIHNALSRGMSPAIIAGLCSEVASIHALVDNNVQAVQKKLNRSSALTDLQVYAQKTAEAYIALSYEFSARSALKKHGLVIGRRRLAVELLDACKVPSSSKAPSIQALREFVAVHAAAIKKTLAALEQDNNKVYYERVIPKSDPEVATQPAARPFGEVIKFEPPAAVDVPITITRSTGCLLQ